jgi:TonB family protein
MSDKYKHSERLEETLRYLNDAMTNEERYSFEREMERDPFMQEAFEGLSGIRVSEIDKDIRSLDIMTGKKRKNFLIVKVLAIAAGFALIFALGFWALQNIDFSKHKTTKVSAEAENIQLREPYKPATTATTDSTTVDSTAVLVADAGLNQPNAGNDLTGKPNALLSDKGTLSKTDQAAKDLNKKKMAMKSAADQKFMQKAQEPVKTPEVSEKPVSETAAQPPVTEVQQRSTEDIAEVENALKRPGVNADPEPLGGSTLFRDYLDKNAKYPKGVQNGKKEFVKVKFKISKLGQPYNIVVEKSPDQEFSREAIRLILEGPKWSPEIKDGIPVEGEVSVKINFKPTEK